MKHIVLIATLMLVACGGGSSGGSIPAPICRDSAGVEVECAAVPPIPICVIFGGCL